MERWIELARATTAEGDELVLRGRGAEFEIRFNGWELMLTRTSVSEAALARLVLAELHRKPARLLVGGLGMGYTLRAALDAVASSTMIVVAELVPAVIDWVRGPLAGLARRPLDDHRVAIHIGVVADMLTGNPGSFDAILLDTDNGPEAVMREANRLLYTREGITLVMRALARGGVAGYWSADRSPAFEAILAEAGAVWRRVDVDARGGSAGPEHSFYLVRKR